MAVAVADLVDNYFVEPRVALANCDREMISMLKMVHRKNLLQRIQKLKERGSSTIKGLHPYSDLYVPAAAKHLSPYRQV